MSLPKELCWRCLSAYSLTQVRYHMHAHAHTTHHLSRYSGEGRGFSRCCTDQRCAHYIPRKNVNCFFLVFLVGALFFPFISLITWTTSRLKSHPPFKKQKQKRGPPSNVFQDAPEHPLSRDFPRNTCTSFLPPPPSHQLFPPPSCFPPQRFFFFCYKRAFVFSVILPNAGHPQIRAHQTSADICTPSLEHTNTERGELIRRLSRCRSVVKRWGWYGIFRRFKAVFNQWRKKLH